MGHDLQVYLNWDLYPILLIYGLGVAIAFLPLIYDRVRKCCKSYCYCLRKRKHLFEGLMFKVSKVILLKEFELKQENGKKEYFMRDQYIPTILMRSVLLLAFQAAVSTVTLATTTFWVVFLIEETFACDPGLDCFPFTDDGDRIQDRPIVNCSDFESADNITIICYRFAFHYAEGFGAAGGVTFFSAFMITAYTSVMFFAARLIWPKNEVIDEDDYDSDEDSEDYVTQEAGSCCKCCDSDQCAVVQLWMGRILFVLIVLSPSVFAIVMLMVVLNVRFLNDIILKTSSSTIQFYAYYISLQYVGVVAVSGLTILVVYIAWSEHEQTRNKQSIPTQQSTRPANGSTTTSREKTRLLYDRPNTTTQYNT